MILSFLSFVRVNAGVHLAIFRSLSERQRFRCAKPQKLPSGLYLVYIINLKKAFYIILTQKRQKYIFILKDSVTERTNKRNGIAVRQVLLSGLGTLQDRSRTSMSRKRRMNNEMHP